MISSVGSKILASSSVMGFFGCLLGGVLAAFFPLPSFFFFGFVGQTDTDRLLRQVHHVADGRLDGVIPAQIFVDRLRLGGRFDDDE